MHSKKKKGKASKFARMTDEERARYLQHRAELELEAKRRKQQLIAAYSKLKLRREEVFSRLNNAKINEQWRSILRKIKSRELFERANYLRQTFDTAIKAKDAVIQNLYEQLELADLDHGKLQKAHMLAIDNLIEQSKHRIHFLLKNYANDVEEKKSVDVEGINLVKEEIKNSNNEMRAIVFLQEQKTDDLLSRTKTENITKAITLKFSNEEEMLNLNLDIGLKIKQVWSHLDQVILDYEKNTEDKRKQYEYMKDMDDTFRLEIVNFPKIQCQMQNTLEALKNEEELLNDKKKCYSTEQKILINSLEQHINKLRQEIKTFQNIDAIQLKYLSAISNETAKILKLTLDKGLSLQMLINVCLDLEYSLNINKYSDQDQDILLQIAKYNVEKPFDVMFKFWDQFNHIKADNVLKNRERARLIAEKTRIQLALKNYLVAMTNTPSIR